MKKEQCTKNQMEPVSNGIIDSKKYWNLCSCCGKGIDELKPFGGPGDPLVGDFTGRYLVKNYRCWVPIDDELESILEDGTENYLKYGFKSEEEYATAKYGEEKVKEVLEYSEASCYIENTWECRDCICLDLNEFYERSDEKKIEEQIEKRKLLDRLGYQTAFGFPAAAI